MRVFILILECVAKADITFIVDNSGSIRDKNPKDGSYDNWVLVKNFVKRVVDSMEIGYNDTRIAVIKFSEAGRIQFNLDKYGTAADVKKAIDKMEYLGGGTNTADAIYLMRSTIFRKINGDRPDIQNIGIIITDGESTYNNDRTASEASAAKKQNISIFAVGKLNAFTLFQFNRTKQRKAQ